MSLADTRRDAGLDTLELINDFAAVARDGATLHGTVAGEGPTLLPVRSVAALVWAALGYGARRLRERQRG